MYSRDGFLLARGNNRVLPHFLDSLPPPILHWKYNRIIFTSIDFYLCGIFSDFYRNTNLANSLRDISLMISLAFAVATDLTIVLLRGRAHLCEENLCDVHARTKNDRYRVHVRELKCNIQIVSWIYQSCGIMDDQSETRKWWLSWELDEVFLWSEFLDTHPEDRYARSQDKSLLRRDSDFFIFWKDMIRRVDVHDRIIFYDQELISEADIVARGLKPGEIEVRDRNRVIFYRGANVTIGEKHNGYKKTKQAYEEGGRNQVNHRVIVSFF